ncbi:MAG: PAS domain S-box protein [Chitinivibrionales bacterium]|nr:PAS domain S-box protein [Chitinivibrionales bacterium]
MSAIKNNTAQIAQTWNKEHARFFIENFIGIAYQLKPKIPQPIFFHGTVEEITGYAVADFIEGRIHWIDLVHPDDRERFDSEAKRLMTIPGHVSNGEYRIYTQTGEIRWLQDIAHAIRDEDNKIVFLQGTIYDKTPQKKAEEALLESETKYRTLFENAGDGIFLMDSNTFIDCNGHALKIFGCRFRDQIIGHSPYEFSPPLQADGRDSRKLALEHIVAALEGWRQFFQWTHTRHDGTSFPAEVSLTKIEIQGKTLVQAIVRDITQRKQAEDEREQTLAILEASLAQSPSGILIADIPDVTIRWANEAAMAIRGKTTLPLKGIDVTRHSASWQLYHPDGTPYPSKKLPLSRAVLKGKATHNEEIIIRDDNGRDHWVSVNAAPVRDKCGRVISGIVVFLEITERKRAEKALRESEARINSIFRAAPIGIGVVSNRVFTRVNDKFCDMVGYSRDELIGKNSRMLYPTIDDYEEVGRVKYRKISQQGTGAVETRFRRKDGKIIEILLSSTPLDPNNLPAGVTFTVLDITARKEATERLKASLREKETLLQELYHRTKNNMQVISAFLELQGISSDNPEVLRIIRESGNRIRTMALAHEKLYKSKSLTRVDMKSYITDVVHLLAASFDISESRINIEFNVQEIDSLIDIAMPCGLILNELVSNCFKYAFPEGRRGRINIALRRLGPHLLELTIADNGVGVPPGFDIMNTSTLGISVVQQIVKSQLRGSLRVETDKGLRWIVHFRDDLYDERV